MRPVDRILRREIAPASRFAVRPFGKSAAEAQAADTAAAASTADSAGTTTNLTTGGSRVRDVDGEIVNRGDTR